MSKSLWPLFDLRVTTPRLQIRLPTDEDCFALARLAAEGIHDADDMPFLIPWTDVASPELERRALQWWWHQRASWSPDNWSFTGGVFVDGEIAGVQDLVAEHFGQLRLVKTGSWLGQRFQGKGLGQEMRAAILHLAFDGLGAEQAHSGAWHDNVRSRRVSEALGYQPNGEQIDLRRGRPTRHLNLRLDRADWRRRDDIRIDGLEECMSLFGLE